jgi:hypothetical protein
MTSLQANASPEKHLFLHMFTRDLTLEDSVLDLIDNSIDSLIKHRNIDVSEALVPIESSSDKEDTLQKSEPASIKIVFNDKYFHVEDNCGGISIRDAVEEVFRFGHSMEAKVGQLGVYGIGLKRAIFKIGNHITITSKTAEEGFRMVIPVPEWSENPSWTLPMEVIEGTGDPAVAGTSIDITSFGKEISERIKSGIFEGHLKEMIARTYCLFLNRYVIVTLNEHIIEPDYIPLGFSEEVTVAKEVFSDNGVTVTMYAGLAARGEDREWRQVDAGWYVACNGRLVVSADKTELTGWGMGMGIFVPKYRGFVGLVLFYSKDPLLLPWTTTKRGLNQESLVFQRTRTRMAAIARPVMRFLDDMYSSEEKEREPQRQVASGMKPQDIRNLTTSSEARFEVKVQPPGEHLFSVQYYAKGSEVERVRKSLGRRSWSARRIGRYTFDHYLKTECPE